MRQRISIYALFLILLLGSCSPEYKLAREFREDPPAFNLLVKPPGTLFKFNHKGEVIEGFSGLSESEQDSALFASSFFIRHISDSVFLEAYVNQFVDELRQLGFTVHLGEEQAAPVLNTQPQAYVVNMAQVQVDEYFYPVEEQEYFYDTLFYKRFDLNALDFSSWIELINWKNRDRPGTTLYSSHAMTDDFEGGFVMDPFQNGVKYRYSIDSLTVDDVYEIAGYLGRIHGSYLYDFFMNQFILFHMQGDIEPLYYYHYNRFRNSFTPVEEERFEILDTN